MSTPSIIDDSSLWCLEKGPLEDVIKILQLFNEKHKQSFSFPELNIDYRRKRFWTQLFLHLNKPSSAVCHKECLTSIRILSRESTDLDKLCGEKQMKILLFHAGLLPENLVTPITKNPFENFDVVMETMKCLCNLLFNCEEAKKLCGFTDAVELKAIMIELCTTHDKAIGKA